MEHWLELRTAYRLAKLGTVIAAADDLGIHRATVNRHVDIVEAAFGAKFFQRHARGYTLTEEGQELLDVASRADEMFSDLAGRSQGKAGQLSGTLEITSLSGLAALIMPAIAQFRMDHPDIQVKLITSEALARLEYGEAHIAIRAGTRPQEPDYVVLPFCKLRFGIYATKSYVEKAGTPDPNDLTGHDFIGSVHGTSRLPYAQWMADNVSQDSIALETIEQTCVSEAVKTGLGLGFLPEHDIQTVPDLIEVIAPQDSWSATLWIVTHVDLHRTLKVQEFLKYLKRLQKDRTLAG